MQRVDLASFETFMQELAECYDRKPYGEAAIKHWFEALSEFRWDKVRYRLTIWRDSKTKPPAISDIVSVLRDQLSDEVERKAIEDKKAYKFNLTPVTEYGSECLAEIKSKLSKMRSPGRWWAYEVRDIWRNGIRLNFAQEQMARKACGGDWDSSLPYPGEGIKPHATVERIPGEDDF